MTVESDGSSGVTVLVVVDMQNDIVKGAFAPPQGYSSVIARVEQVLTHARSAGWPVIFTQVCYRDGYVDAPPALPVAAMGVLRQGSSGAAIIDDLAPKDGEHILVKRRTNPFYGSDLAVLLQSLSAKRLVIAGVASHRAVESLAREAADRDYEVIVLEDACGAPNPEHHEAAMSVVADWFGRVSSVKDLIKS